MRRVTTDSMASQSYGFCRFCKSGTARTRSPPAAQALEIATPRWSQRRSVKPTRLAARRWASERTWWVGQGAPGQLPVHDPVSLLVYGSQGSDVRHVFVEGDLLVEHGQLTAQTGLDVERLRAHSAEQMPVLPVARVC